MRNLIPSDEISPQKRSIDPDTYAFIIRLWRENKSDGKDPGDWRGSVDYVGSNQRLYFLDLDGLADFIHRHSGIPLSHNAHWWHTLRNLFQNGTK